MKTRTAKIYTSIVYAIVLALYFIVFISFVPRPYSHQVIFFFIFVPVLIVLNWAINIIQMSFRDIDSLIATGSASLIVQAVYDGLALIASVVLAVFSAAMKTQIVVQIILLLIAVAILVVILYSASLAKSTKKSRSRVEVKKEVKSLFTDTVVKMEEKGLSGSVLENLRGLCEDYRHVAPCSDPAALSIDEDIASELRQMLRDDISRTEVHISKIKFLISRRSQMRSC